MRKLAPILTSILLGALAVAVGMGIYLKKANTDRERLSALAVRAQEDATRAQSLSQQAIEAANQKLDAANTEMVKAQNVIKSLQEERDLMTKAQMLETPKASSLKGWKEAVNLSLGVSLKFPATSRIETNDTEALTISKGTVASDLSDQRWLSITPYNDRLEQELQLNLATSTPVSYLVHGRLLIGVRGTVPGTSGDVFILKIRYAGQITHLLWARDPATTADARTLLQSLATLDFKS